MEIDRERTRRLAETMLRSVMENYRLGPSSRDRVWESLNALAFVAATVILGTGDRDGRRAASAFFEKALNQSTADLMRNPPL